MLKQSMNQGENKANKDINFDYLMNYIYNEKKYNCGDNTIIICIVHSNIFSKKQ